MSDIVSKVSSYAWTAEQAVVCVTLSVLGASLGLLEGTFRGFQRLQPNFRSREGLEDLLYGSNHKENRGSVTELLKSWIPFLHHSQPTLKHLKAQKEEKTEHTYTNGVAPQAGEVLKEPPISEKPPKPQVDTTPHSIHSFYSDDSEAAIHKPTTPDLVSHKPQTPQLVSEAAAHKPVTPELVSHKPQTPDLVSHKPQTPQLVSHRPNTPSSEHHTWDNGSFSTHRDDLSSVTSYERGASSDAEVSDASATVMAGAPKAPGAPAEPGTEPKKKRKGLKKLTKGLKKAFVEPFEKMGSRSSSRNASPKKRT